MSTGARDGPDSAANRGDFARAVLGQGCWRALVVQRQMLGPDSAEDCLEVPQMQFWLLVPVIMQRVPAVRSDS